MAKLTINGIDVTDAIRLGDGFQPPRWERRRNQRGRLTVDLELKPTKRHEAIWYAKDGTTPLFGGLVERRKRLPVAAGAPYCARVELVELTRYYDWCYTSLAYVHTGPVTLRTIMTHLVVGPPFVGTRVQFLIQQAEFYRYLSEGDPGFLTFFYEDTLVAYAAQISAIESDLTAIIAAMGTEEHDAFDSGCAAALIGGFEGSEEEFLIQQAEYYRYLPEGDDRLLTVLSGDTIDDYAAAMASINSELLAVIAGMSTDEAAAFDEGYANALQLGVLGRYGFTLHSGQVAGPTYAGLKWTRRRVADAIRDLGGDQSDYIDSVSPLKVIRMFVAGSVSGPTSLTDALSNVSSFETDDSTQTPANYVTCVFGPSGTGAEPIVHTWVAEGDETSFSLDGVNVPASAEWPGVVVIDDVSLPIWPAGAGGANDIEWDYQTAKGTLTLKGTSADLIEVGTVIALTYLPTYPFNIIKTTGASPIIEDEVKFPDETQWAPADVKAQQYIDQLVEEPRVFSAQTLEDGFDIGQAVTIDVASADAEDTSGIVTEVAGQANTSLFWEYTLKLEEGAVLQADPITASRRQLNVSGGGSGSVSIVSAGGGGGSVTVLSSPFPMGGSRHRAQPVGTTRTPVVDWLPFVAPADMTIVVRASVRARDSGVTVTPCLEVYNGGDMTWDLHETGTGMEVTEDTEQTFATALSASLKYRVAYLTNTADAEACCIAQLENVA